MFLNKIKRPNGNEYRLCINQSKTHILALGIQQGQNQSKPKICFCKQYVIENKYQLKKDLKGTPFQGALTTFILNDGYELLLADLPPQVDLSDGKSMKRYAAGYFSSAIEDSVLDYIEVPQRNEHKKRKCYLISAQKEKLTELINEYRQVGVNIDSIQILESGIKALATRLEEDHDGALFILLMHDKTFITLTKNNILYMMRTVETASSINENSANDIADETQNTIDYCNANLGILRSNRIVLASDRQMPNGLLSILSDRLGLPGRIFDVNEVIDFDSDNNIDQTLLLANLGGALTMSSPS